MTFDRLIWKNGDPTTPLSADNLNRIEQAIVDLIDELDAIKNDIKGNSDSIALMYDSIQTLSTRVSALVEEVKLLKAAQENLIRYDDATGEIILG